MTDLDALQLSLFEDESTPAVQRSILAEIHWSYSRRSCLEQCPRRYYYTYFGANKRTAKHEAAKDRLHFLKSLSNRHERTGAIVHLAIKTYFRKAHTGEVWDAPRLVQFARRIFHEDRRYSQGFHAGPHPVSGPFPPTLLREYYYQHPDADALCAEAEERLALAIESFVSNPAFAAFRAAGSQPTALVEHDIAIPEFPCHISGKIDLAFAANDGVTVVDWKLGSGDGTGSESLQLATYGLWAVQHFGCAPDQLRVCKAHLASGEIVDFTVSAAVLAAARARILQDAARMADMHAYGQQAMAEAFSPCLQRAICGLCAFEGECYG